LVNITFFIILVIIVLALGCRAEIVADALLQVFLLSELNIRVNGKGELDDYHERDDS
jgi:hypothetical protein